MEYTKQQLLEKYKKLPPALQNAMGSEAYVNAIRDIATKHVLSKEQTRKVTETVGYVILGVVEAEDLVHTLKKELNTDDEAVNGVAKELNEKIFIPIREALQNAHGKPAQAVTPQPPKQPSEPVSEGLPVMQKKKEETEPAAPTNLPGAIPVAENEEGITKEEVLKAIEDAPEEKPVSQPEVAEKVPQAKSFIEEKLSATTTNAKQTVEATTPQGYGADPYREPIE